MCPFAVRKGPLIRCMVTDSYTSPLFSPCTGNFLKCDKIRHLPDPCPYLEITRKGAICKVTNKTVEKPWECIKGKYVECPIYKRASEEVKETEEAEEERVELTTDEKGEEVVVIRNESGSEKVEKITCEECIFYSSVTGRCVKLKVKVEDPSNPPCEGKYFKPRKK